MSIFAMIEKIDFWKNWILTAILFILVPRNSDTVQNLYFLTDSFVHFADTDINLGKTNFTKKKWRVN